MSQHIELKAGDGHTFGCYVVEPADTPRGVIMVLQEVFGVNEHIRSVADDYAAEGYLAVAPALFDRLQRDFQTGYEPDDISRALAFKKQAKGDDAMHDLAAVIGHFSDAGPIGVVGYCWGGSMAWLAATRLPVLHAAVCYYGSNIVDHIGEHLHCPTLCHFGEQDASIPAATVAQIRSRHPSAVIHTYPADHGFNCDQRGSYHPDSARLARQRSLEFFAQHVG